MIYLVILIVLAIIDIIVLYIISLTCGKRFDKLLRNKGLPSIPNTFMFIFPNAWARATYYVTHILFFPGPIKEKNSFRYRQYQKRFGDFCFRDEATRTEIILSAVYVGLLALNLFYFIGLSYITYK